jgi:ligand-binding sensor domain-containing protein
LIRSIKYFLIFLFFAQATFGLAQTPALGKNAVNFNFKNFGTKEGLPLSSSTCILQDQFGLVWLGTQDGLYRYDGYQFIAYKFNPDDDQSIGGNIVNCLIEDKQGNIWVGTDNGGLCVFNRRTSSFQRFPKLYWKKEMYKIQSISSLLQASNGNIWFSNSQFQYFILDVKTNEIYPLKYDLLERMPDYYRVTNMLEDKNKTVWLATQFGLYYSVSNDTKVNLTFMANKIYKKIPDMSFQAIQFNRNSSDSIYLVTNDGVILSYNVNTNAYTEQFSIIAKTIKENVETVQ